MDWNWDNSVSIGFLICLFLGIVLLKDHNVWVWSLKQRINLRGGSAKHRNTTQKIEKIMAKCRKWSPVQLILGAIKEYRQQRMGSEIFEAITFLRNLASIEKGRTSSTDYVIERLSEHNGLLQPIYLKMLNLLRVNQTKEAVDFFSQKVGTPAGRDFASLLIRWDNLEPSELTEILLSYEKNLKAVRITEQKKKDELVSDLIYFPVVVNILVIFINFIYIAYFLDQKEMLQMFM